MRNALKLAAVCLVLLFALPVFAQNPPYRHGVMQPDSNTLIARMNAYATAPRVPTIDQIANVSATIESFGSGTSFDLLGYTPWNASNMTDRNQGSCGNCWVWAGTGVMEIALAWQTGVTDRLSVQYYDSCSTSQGAHGCSACNGGDLTDLRNWYAGSQHQFAVPWSNTGASYANGGACRACSAIATTPRYTFLNPPGQVQTVSTYHITTDQAVSNIKTVLNGGQAIEFDFYLPNNTAWNTFMDFWDNQPESTVWDPDTYCGVAYSDSAGGAGHGVVVVGYNDTDANPDNHYWVLMNSWGATTGRPDGLFYMKMNMNYACDNGSVTYSREFRTVDFTYVANRVGFNTVTGTGPATLSTPTSGAYFTSFSSLSDTDGSLNQTGKPSGLVFSQGLVSYSLSVPTAGQTAAVSLTFPNALAAGTKVYKVNSGGFYEYTNATISGNTVTLNLQDGGSGDSDGAPNSVIVDPVGPASPPSVATAGEGGAGGGGGGGGGGCFIATAAYGSYLDPHVVVLRVFRDRRLAGNAAGRKMIALYYAWSPPAARFIARHETARAVTRCILTPIVLFAEYPISSSTALFVIVLMGAGIFSRPSRRTPR